MEKKEKSEKLKTMEKNEEKEWGGACSEQIVMLR